MELYMAAGCDDAAIKDNIEGDRQMKLLTDLKKFLRLLCHDLCHDESGFWQIFAPILIGAASAGSSIYSAYSASSAASSAASKQEDATKYAADLQAQAANRALDLQEEAYYNQRYDMAPWLQMGTGATGLLSYAMGIPSQYNPYSATQSPISGQQYSSPYLNSPQMVQKRQNLSSQIESLNAELAKLQGEYDEAKTDFSRHIFTNRMNMVKEQLNPLMSDYERTTGGIPYGEEIPSGTTAATTGTPIAEGESPFGFGELAQPMSEVMQNWQQDPGYEFRQQQGEKSVNRFLADKGMPFGGQAAKSLLEFNQNFASQEYGNVYNRTAADRQDRFNRLASLAGMGQTTSQYLAGASTANAANQGNILMNSANIQGDLATQAANARASSTLYGSNAWNQAFGNLAALPGQIYGMYNLFNTGSGGTSGGLSGTNTMNNPWVNPYNFSLG
jgi:F0F1-type ATP synthase membrane subunit c/vacuolar-type H+-ATPase subunit K